MSRLPSTWTWLKLACLCILVAFVAVPLITIFKNSLFLPDGKLSLTGYADFFGTPVHLQSLQNSLLLGLITTMGALLIGVPLAFAIARYNFPLKTVVAALPLVTFVMPDIIVTQAWLMVLGNNGIVTRFLASQLGITLPSFYSWFGLIFMMILQHFSYVYLMMLSSFYCIDVNIEDAARSLGSSSIRVYRTVSLPLVVPGILTASLVVFTQAVDNFGIPIIVAPRLPILSVDAYTTFLSEFSGGSTMQSVMSVLLVSIAGIVLLLQKWVTRRSQIQMEAGRTPRSIELTPGKALCLTAALLCVIVISLLPFAVILIGAFTKSVGPVLHWGEFSLSNFDSLGVRGLGALYNSLFLASVASLFGVIFGSAVAYLTVKKPSFSTYIIDYLSLVPLAVSGTVLGIGLINTYNSGPIILTGTWIIMAAAYFIRRVPYALNTTVSAVRSVRDNLEEASISLGVPPVRSVFNVVYPLIRPALISSGIFMWVTTLSELSATLVLYTPGLETMPIQIYHQIDGGFMGIASAYSLILITSIFVPLAIARGFFKIDVFGTKSR